MPMPGLLGGQWSQGGGPRCGKSSFAKTHHSMQAQSTEAYPNGGGFGLAQLNGSYHFERAGEDFRRWSDPVVNLRTALWVRTVYGRFGGEGGWANCAALLGIH